MVFDETRDILDVLKRLGNSSAPDPAADVIRVKLGNVMKS
jgi:hypothetical protein